MEFRGILHTAVAFLFSGFVASSTGHAESERELFSDSGIEGPSYEEIIATHDQLAVTYAGWATSETYGQTAQERPLRIVRIQNPKVGKGNPNHQRPGVLISGSIHGNEYLNIEDRLAGWFLANKTVSPGLMRYLDAGGVIYIIPVMNPDGYANRERGNSNGVDLNRDFDLVPENESNFRELETQSARSYLEQELLSNNVALNVTVDYHCCDGSLLFPWSYTMDNLPEDLLSDHNHIAKLMTETIGSDYRFGSTGQVLGYNPRGTSKDYYFARFGALAFTFEGNWRTENENFDKHTLWWDHIFAWIVSRAK